MKCGRCGNPMRNERSWSVSGWVFSWLCAICGEVIDPLILANRLGLPDPEVPVNYRKIKEERKLPRICVICLIKPARNTGKTCCEKESAVLKAWSDHVKYERIAAGR